jgi:hypothetical protein
MLMNASLASNMIAAMHAELNTLIGSGAVIQCWDGTPPASISAGDAGSMIAECGCSSPAFGSVSAGVANLSPSTDDTNTAAGTVQYWRLKQSGGTTVLQWNEGVDFITDDPAFLSGDTCHIVDIELTYTVTPPDS